MKVVCINNCWYHTITIGKTYDAIKIDDYYYTIINDNSLEDWYPKEYFKLLSEYRIEKINKLLEDES